MKQSLKCQLVSQSVIDITLVNLVNLVKLVILVNLVNLVDQVDLVNLAILVILVNLVNKNALFADFLASTLLQLITAWQ